MWANASEDGECGLGSAACRTVYPAYLDLVRTGGPGNSNYRARLDDPLEPWVPPSVYSRIYMEFEVEIDCPLVVEKVDLVFVLQGKTPGGLWVDLCTWDSQFQCWYCQENQDE